VPSRLLRVAGPAILVFAAVVTLIAGLAYGGGAARQLQIDPGPVVRWGLPVATLAVNLSAAALIGALVLALFALRAQTRPFDTALDVASVAAAVFTVASASVAFLTVLNVLGATPSAGAEFG